MGPSERLLPSQSAHRRLPETEVVGSAVKNLFNKNKFAILLKEPVVVLATPFMITDPGHLKSLFLIWTSSGQDFVA